MPPSTTLLIFDLVQLVFVFAFGACVGSLLNVIAYRMPLGIGIVSPPSRCPHCETRLSFWKDNIPVFGWIFLRGRCRYCQTRISPEYPLVEAAVGLVAVAFYLFWYVLPPGSTEVLGVDLGAVSPDWTLHGTFRRTWPVYLVLMGLIGSLAAMTLVDAKTCMIPLPLAWFPTLLAVIVLPIYAWHADTHYRGDWMPLPSPGREGWQTTIGAIGAVLGIGISVLMVQCRLIRPSFADYEAWEKEAIEARNAESNERPEAPGMALGRLLAVLAVGIAGGASGHFVGALLGLRQGVGIGLGAALAVLVAGALTRPKGTSPEDENGDLPADLWIQYPHARREMVRELAFLAPAAILGWIGYAWVGVALGGDWTLDPVRGVMAPANLMPAWLEMLGAVLVGYLVGGGIVWAIRIFGTLGFGKEAMGLGDVHLLAAVGACVGWIDATLAFFAAPFVGLYWTALHWAFTGNGRSTMPYGPFLAIGTVVVLFARPGLEAWLSSLFNQPITLP